LLGLTFSFSISETEIPKCSGSGYNSPKYELIKLIIDAEFVAERTPL
jgi:hypothetical protein